MEHQLLMGKETHGPWFGWEQICYVHQQIVGLEQHPLNRHKNNVNQSELNNNFSEYICTLCLDVLWSSPACIVKIFNCFGEHTFISTKRL